MKVTQEADYAIRICCVLDEAGGKIGAAEISERAGVTQRFSLKILRKLLTADIVSSFVGSQGGYILKKDANILSVAEIIEAIDGDMFLSKCMECNYECTRNPQKSNCKMHVAFCAVSKTLKEMLSKITVRMITDKAVTAADVVAITTTK